MSADIGNILNCDAKETVYTVIGNRYRDTGAVDSEARNNILAEASRFWIELLEVAPPALQARTFLETTTATTQCEENIGLAGDNKVGWRASNNDCECWICGFPLWRDDIRNAAYGNEDGWDFQCGPGNSPECEHMLPVMLAFLIFGGIYRTSNISELHTFVKSQLKYLYLWAHPKCNQKKSDKEWLDHAGKFNSDKARDFFIDTDGLFMDAQIQKAIIDCMNNGDFSKLDGMSGGGKKQRRRLKGGAGPTEFPHFRFHKVKDTHTVTNTFIGKITLKTSSKTIKYETYDAGTAVAAANGIIISSISDEEQAAYSDADLVRNYTEIQLLRMTRDMKPIEDFIKMPVPGASSTSTMLEIAYDNQLYLLCSVSTVFEFILDQCNKIHYGYIDDAIIGEMQGLFTYYMGARAGKDKDARDKAGRETIVEFFGAAGELYYDHPSMEEIVVQLGDGPVIANGKYQAYQPSGSGTITVSATSSTQISVTVPWQDDAIKIRLPKRSADKGGEYRFNQSVRGKEALEWAVKHVRPARAGAFFIKYMHKGSLAYKFKLIPNLAVPRHTYLDKIIDGKNILSAAPSKLLYLFDFILPLMKNVTPLGMCSSVGPLINNGAGVVNAFFKILPQDFLDDAERSLGVNNEITRNVFRILCNKKIAAHEELPDFLAAGAGIPPNARRIARHAKALSAKPLQTQMAEVSEPINNMLKKQQAFSDDLKYADLNMQNVQKMINKLRHTVEASEDPAATWLQLYTESKSFKEMITGFSENIAGPLAELRSDEGLGGIVAKVKGLVGVEAQDHHGVIQALISRYEDHLNSMAELVDIVRSHVVANNLFDMGSEETATDERTTDILFLHMMSKFMSKAAPGMTEAEKGKEVQAALTMLTKGVSTPSKELFKNIIKQEAVEKTVCPPEPNIRPFVRDTQHAIEAAASNTQLMQLLAVADVEAQQKPPRKLVTTLNMIAEMAQAKEPLAPGKSPDLGESVMLLPIAGAELYKQLSPFAYTEEQLTTSLLKQTDQASGAASGEVEDPNTLEVIERLKVMIIENERIENHTLERCLNLMYEGLIPDEKYELTYMKQAKSFSTREEAAEDAEAMLVPYTAECLSADVDVLQINGIIAEAVDEIVLSSDAEAHDLALKEMAEAVDLPLDQQHAGLIQKAQGLIIGILQDWEDVSKRTHLGAADPFNFNDNMPEFIEEYFSSNDWQDGELRRLIQKLTEVKFNLVSPAIQTPPVITEGGRFAETGNLEDLWTELDTFKRLARGRAGGGKRKTRNKRNRKKTKRKGKKRKTNKKNRKRKTGGKSKRKSKRKSKKRKSKKRKSKKRKSKKRKSKKRKSKK